MKNLVKNIFRYSGKNKFSIIGIFILFFIAVSCVLTLSLLSNNFNTTYNKIVRDSNLQNIVLNENFTNNEVGRQKKEELLKILNAPTTEIINNDHGQGVEARPFESINVSTTQNSFKIINYSDSYKISKMFYFDTGGVENFRMPEATNFEDIINKASYDLQNKPFALNAIPKEEIIKARQQIVYFASKSHWSKKSIKDKFVSAYSKIVNDKTIDPIDSTIPEVAKISSDLRKWLDSNNKQYSPILNKGYRIIFQVPNELVPESGYYDDIFSFVAVVSPEFLKNNNKEIFSLNKYKELTKTTNGLNINSIDVDQFNNGWTETGWTGINNIDDKYFITVDSIKYLIVATGITPDFLYPIISFDNLIVDFSKEAILYVDNAGFQRAKNSWQTAPTENLILVKHNASESNIKGKINELNELAHKYMSFPENFQIAYSFNDDSNVFSPTALRVSFVTDLMLSLNVISFILTIFLVIISLFVLVFILDKFIQENKNNFYILIANGIDKWKAIFTLMFVPIIPLFLSSLFGYIFAWFIQPAAFSLFSQYWGIPTFFSLFNPAWALLVFGLLILISSIVIAILGFLRLKGNVSNGLKEKKTKTSFLSRIIKIPFQPFTSIIFRFRISLAFSSLSKILFSTLISFLLTTCLVFLGSSNSDFRNSINDTKSVNNYSNMIELNTPTRTGGQYYSSSFKDIGSLLYAKNDTQHLNPLNPSFYKNEGPYQKVYQTNELFRTWSQILWPSASDKEYKEDKLEYLYNKTILQPIMDITFGVGSISSNPWVDLTKPLLPFNQASASNDLTNQLFSNLYNDYNVVNISGLPKDKNWVKTNKLFLTKDNNLDFYFDQTPLPILNISNIKEFNNIDDITQVKNYLEIITNNFPNNFITNPKLINITKNEKGYVLELEGNQFEYITNNKYISYFYEVLMNEPSNKETYISVIDKTINKTVYIKIIPKNTLAPALFFSQLNKDFINYWLSIFSSQKYQKYFYKITYNQVPIEKDDEKFVYIDSQLRDSRISSKYKTNNNIKIIGVQQNSKYIKLINSKNQDISKLLINNKSLVEHPLIINEYAAKEYNLKVGDTLTVFPKNHVERFHTDFNSNSSKFIALFNVVGVVKSTKGSEFFTDINVARQILGLATSSDFQNNSEPKPILDYPFPENLKKVNNLYDEGGFNGFFTNDNYSILTNNVGLYSNSGMYPGNDNFEKSLSLETLFKNKLFPDNPIDFNTNLDFQLISNALFLKQNELQDLIQQIKDAGKDVVKQNVIISNLITKLNTIYGNLIYESSITSVQPQNILLDSFNSVIQTIDKIKIIVITLLIILTLLMLLFVSWILINEMKLLFVLLKTQGYSDFMNLMSALSIFIPIWILSIIFTIPASIFSLSIFNEFIFLKMGILLNSTVHWGFFFLAIFTLLFVLLLIMCINYFKLKKENIILALKW